ncbi:hypothetical protein BST27_04180 [Mycobacterium intermedium]|uniref:DoxX family protein n=1 Tax=Mycobacterium intermedium TaxID=28445 RepID=A0A1E3SGU7_MYCIE|nr:hypothetical protein [Mycobacterium intermedium]MCV6966247.1 hypothetical protein [Mycobacterium intermedium]ODR00883.1 hypothetical protein BHQ20_10730 [Mycobacterium intermedium]OPE52059.1 hypothetical protein BV508_04035 [Mycobacterium intermedium]ORB09775.1 hypothetical protein BST27_04180 [Mycobacterium intermedium]
MSPSGQTDRNWWSLAGALVVGIGLAHFVFPAYFDPINKIAFPEHPRRYTYINGGFETLIGLTLLEARERNRWKVVGLAYVSYLLLNLVRARGVSRLRISASR